MKIRLLRRSRSGRFGVAEGGIREIVGQHRGSCNPLRSPLDALVRPVPFLHRPRVGPVFGNSHLRLSVHGTITQDVPHGEGLAVADREGPRRLVLLVCRHPY